jgi:hypothetical protein
MANSLDRGMMVMMMMMMMMMMFCKYKSDYCDIIGQNVEYQSFIFSFVWSILFMVTI